MLVRLAKRQIRSGLLAGDDSGDGFIGDDYNSSRPIRCKIHNIFLSKTQLKILSKNAEKLEIRLNFEKLSRFGFRVILTPN